MKTILIILTIALSGCSTMKQAQTDFDKFRMTIDYNLKQDVVKEKAYF